MRVLGYIRCSTIEQKDSGLGLEAQRATIGREVARRGWSVEYVEDVRSAKDLQRPGLVAALAKLAAGEADVLMSNRLDRLSRSVHDFAGMTATASKQRWSLVALDLGVDTSTPEGDLFANIRASVSQYERKLIGVRTREALAVLKASGVKLGGSERIVSREVEAKARELRASGLTQRAVGAALLAEGHHGPKGGDWSPSTLHRMLTRAA